NRPFLARNIRDFWNRWHITLSFWFRDHVYMRFLLAAARGKWFRSMHTAAILGYFLAFGLMGLWHGIEPHYILYGLYMATLLSGFHIFSSWKKRRREGALWPALAIFITFNSICFGLLIFFGRLRHPDKFHRLLRRDRKRQRFRVSKANVFTCKNHNPPRDETEIFPRVQHFCQPVHRAFFIRSAHAFDERADGVVVRVADAIV